MTDSGGGESDTDDQPSDGEGARKKRGTLIDAAQVGGVCDLSFGKLQLLFLGFPDIRGMELFCGEVVPAFRSGPSSFAP
ncbi:hypothetical protein [Halococcus salifodinae]|uniref:hypothetical protein n=1 Tax=Halococcus salifodinae TaxID=36738 RepID=UPI0012685A19|nr:hypothetical protein [Halococcus salifodinae]